MIRVVKQDDPDEYNTADLAQRLDKHDLILVEPVVVDEQW